MPINLVLCETYISEPQTDTINAMYTGSTSTPQRDRYHGLRFEVHAFPCYETRKLRLQ
jgi:hypothetical protein